MSDGDGSSFAHAASLRGTALLSLGSASEDSPASTAPMLSLELADVASPTGDATHTAPMCAHLGARRQSQFSEA